MKGMPNHGKIYKQIVEMLEGANLNRKDIISACLSRAGLTTEELSDKSSGSRQNIIRSRVGAVISEMEARDLIALDKDGRYGLVVSKPVVIRIEKCEKELIRLLSEGSMERSKIREHLMKSFGADKTAFKICMNLAGGLRRLGTFFDGPCTTFITACG